MKFTVTVLFTLFLFSAAAQNVGIGTNSPHPSAKLDVSSVKAGFLPPRMTSAQRDSIVNPSRGLMIYCINCGPNGEWQGFDGSEWTNMSGERAQSSEYTMPFTQIGDQIWMKKNLDVSKYRNGDIIPQIKDSAEWANATYGAWCYYNNDPYFGEKYGKLYNWYAVNDPRGLAPQGWHIPDLNEFKQMMINVDPYADTANTTQYYVGEKFRECNSPDWNDVNSFSSCDNQTGFSGLPGSYRLQTGFGSFEYGIWWLSTSYNLNGANFFFLTGNSLIQSGTNKSFGFSVRCIADVENNLNPKVIVSSLPPNPDKNFSLLATIQNPKNISILDKGFCWSTEPLPNIAVSNKTSKGVGSASFRSRVTNLQYNTDYYLRPYLTTTNGVIYGNQLTFTTCDNTVFNFSNTTGGYPDSYDDFNGDAYTYTSTINSFIQTSPTTAQISVQNLFDLGWGPVTFNLNWTDPADIKANVVDMDTIPNSNAGAAFGSAYEGRPMCIRAAQGQGQDPDGSFSPCGESFEFKVQIGVAGFAWYDVDLYVRLER